MIRKILCSLYSPQTKFAPASVILYHGVCRLTCLVAIFCVLFELMCLEPPSRASRFLFFHVASVVRTACHPASVICLVHTVVCCFILIGTWWFRTFPEPRVPVLDSLKGKPFSVFLQQTSAVCSTKSVADLNINTSTMPSTAARQVSRKEETVKRRGQSADYTHDFPVSCSPGGEIDEHPMHPAGWLHCKDPRIISFWSVPNRVRSACSKVWPIRLRF